MLGANKNVLLKQMPYVEENTDIIIYYPSLLPPFFLKDHLHLH